MEGFFGVLLILALYFLPTIIAWNKSFVLQVFFLNLLVGWTFIGWVIAFIWAFNKDASKQIRWHKTVPVADTKTDHDDVYAALEKLSELHKKGIITDAEFAEQKSKLLNK
jgi:hypothetical protein